MKGFKVSSRPVYVFHYPAVMLWNEYKFMFKRAWQSYEKKRNFALIQASMTYWPPSLYMLRFFNVETVIFSGSFFYMKQKYRHKHLNVDEVFFIIRAIKLYPPCRGYNSPRSIYQYCSMHPRLSESKLPFL